MFSQDQDDSRKQHEEQASSPQEEMHSQTPASSLRISKTLKRDKRLQHQRNRHRPDINNICSILLAIGLTFIVLGRFLGSNTLLGFIIESSGWVAFLCGIAMFAAIVKTTLDV